MQQIEKMEYVGPYIYYICQIKNLSLSAICSYAGISYLELNNIYNGKHEPHPSTLKRICDFVGIDFIALFKKQEKYAKLLNSAFHALTYDIIDEQEALMQKIEAIDFEESILYPDYLLLRMIYLGMNDPVNDEYEKIIQKLEIFVNVFSNDYKGLYFIYKGIYYRVNNQLDETLKCFQQAEKISPFQYSELLYQHYGTLCYRKGQYVETLNYYHKAYALYEKKWNINRLLYTKNAIGFCYIGMQRYDLADKALHRTLELATQYKNTYVMQSCYSDLSYTHLLMRDYKGCVDMALRAINAGCSQKYLYFYLAYSYAKMEAYGEAALWAGKREQMEKGSIAYDCLIYVKQIIDREEDISFMHNLYNRMGDTRISEARIILLEDVANIYHESDKLSDENRVLHEILNIVSK